MAKPRKSAPVRPQDTRIADTARLGQPEDERARKQRNVRMTDATWRLLQRAATRERTDVSTFVERWVSAGCPLASEEK